MGWMYALVDTLDSSPLTLLRKVVHTCIQSCTDTEQFYIYTTFSELYTCVFDCHVNHNRICTNTFVLNSTYTCTCCMCHCGNFKKLHFSGINSKVILVLQCRIYCIMLRYIYIYLKILFFFSHRDTFFISFFAFNIYSTQFSKFSKTCIK